MTINVVGKQIDIGDSLREHVETSLSGGISKYFERPAQAHVTFSKDGNGFRCDCSVHLDSGIQLQSSGNNQEIYAAFESAADRIETRLRRYKRRLKNHHSHSKDQDLINASSYVIAAESDSEEEPETLQPIIIAENETQIRTCTAGEAVMHMDLIDTPALVFHNSAHGRINVVYRRADGNIGWIDPSDKKASA